jgi:hypothetical protein
MKYNVEFVLCSLFAWWYISNSVSFDAYTKLLYFSYGQVNSSITFSTKRTREPDIAHKARSLLNMLAINVPALMVLFLFIHAIYF